MLLIAPVVLGFLTGAFCWLLRARPAAQRLLSLSGAAAQLAVAVAVFARVWSDGPFAAPMSGWPAPYGIILAVDLMGAAMLGMTALVLLASVTFGFSEVAPRAEKLGHHTMLHVMVAGVCGAFVTGDLFNLYVWFEVLLIGSFGLLVAGEGRRRLDGAMRYAALNLLATIAFLAGVGLLYGATGALNMADLARAAAQEASQTQKLVTAAFLFFAFAAKAAIFPVFAWLPASYHTPGFTVSAAFSALLTKVGVYAAYRSFTLIYGLDTPFLSDLLLWCGGLSMIVGALCACAQTELRRVLAFQVIASVGYAVAALGLATQDGLTAGLFYLIQDMALKAGLFMSAWLIVWRLGTESFAHGGGLWRRAPWLSVLFLLGALALAGAPPFAGFWGKLLIVRAALEVELWWIAVSALLTGLLTLYSMGRVWAEMIWKARPQDDPALAERPALPRPALIAATVMTAIPLALGLFPSLLYTVASRAAAALLDPAAYIAASMGAGG